ncbi:replication-associated protein [Tick-associated circular DNA satellite]|nr:replication-associated protein [Tick-associated circular DNA satellite]
MNNKNSLKDSFKNSIFNNAKDQFLKIEEMSNGSVYAITYNPQTQPDHPSLNGFVDWWGEQQELFDRCTNCAVRLYCEISKTGRVHFHGLVKILNRVKFGMFDVPRLIKFGSTVIKQIEHYDEWISYCLKIQNDMQDFIIREFNPMINDKYLKESSDYEKVITTFKS